MSDRKYTTDDGFEVRVTWEDDNDPDLSFLGEYWAPKTKGETPPRADGGTRVVIHATED